jgi:hypothetical protein
VVKQRSLKTCAAGRRAGKQELTLPQRSARGPLLPLALRSSAAAGLPGWYGAALTRTLCLPGEAGLKAPASSNVPGAAPAGALPTLTSRTISCPWLPPLLALGGGNTGSCSSCSVASRPSRSRPCEYSGKVQATGWLIQTDTSPLAS